MGDYDGWAVLEVFGHKRVAGMVTEVELAGHPMVRVDVPCDPPAFQLFGVSSVFSFTPCTEEKARLIGAVDGIADPIGSWELRRAAALTAGAPAEDDDAEEALCVGDEHDLEGVTHFHPIGLDSEEHQHLEGAPMHHVVGEDGRYRHEPDAVGTARLIPIEPF